MDKLRLKAVLIAQKKDAEAILKDNIIDREILESSRKYMDSNMIKVVTGIRRCGKSVLSFQLLNGRNFAYANFDDERLSEIRAKDFDDILEVLHETYGNFKYLFLDELQNIDKWELFVNRCRRQGYNVLLTGSNAKLLSKELATHLTGRYVELELYPFSFREYLRYLGKKYSEEDFYLPEKIGEIKKFLNDYIETGGFPEVLKYQEIRIRYLTDLYNAIIGKDIITRYNIRHSKALKDMASYLISNYGSFISYNRLKNIFNIKSVHTIENYVSYIAESYLAFQMLPFSFKVKEQLISPKKIYAIDTGMINAVSSKTFDNKSRLIENAVFLDILRRHGRELFYYKSKQQEEVDFVLKEGLKAKQLIQVCYSLDNEDTKKREIRALLKASEELKCKNLLVVTWDYEGEEETDGKKIIYAPLWKWLLKEPQ